MKLSPNDGVMQLCSDGQIPMKQHEAILAGLEADWKAAVRSLEAMNSLGRTIVNSGRPMSDECLRQLREQNMVVSNLWQAKESLRVAWAIEDSQVNEMMRVN